MNEETKKNEVDSVYLCIWQSAVKSKLCLTLCWATTFGFCVASSQDKVGESMLCSSEHAGTNPGSANMEILEMKCKFKGTICFPSLESLEKF